MAAEDIAELQRAKYKRWSLIIVFMVLALFAAIIICLSIGVVSIPFDQVISILMGGGSDRDRHIIFNLRLPRVLLGVIVGASLAVAGATMQGLFRNPMASPSVIGISAGAAFGASLALVLGVSWVSGAFAIPAMAFLFAFITLFLVYAVSRDRRGYVPVETLLLAGIAIGALFNALVSALQYFAGDKLSGVVFWLMGGLNNATWDQILISIPAVILGCAVIMMLSRDLNAIMVGEEQAGNLGINVNQIRMVLLLAASLVTAIAVSVAGTIGFVGLIIPHVLRILVGPDHRVLLPASIIGGALFMVATDTLARTIIAPAELPVGIITSLLGAPFFIYLLMSRKKSMGW
ncbi:MAG: iron chelate uptake ABC transporter family permease subunit [Methanomassiliicoccus sp.]|jgi:iron complex transport system permease protein|nr:iron chelate uptake ABC transporter family permease subunit [Methanomassiliicoccus sp.]